MEYNSIKAVMRRLYKVIATFDHEFDLYDYTLTESIVVGIIARNPGIIATNICDDIRIDKGQLSRILKKLEAKDVIERRTISAHTLEKHLELTLTGEKLYTEMQEMVDRSINEHLTALDEYEREDFLKNMEDMERQLMILVPDDVTKY